MLIICESVVDVQWVDGEDQERRYGGGDSGWYSPWTMDKGKLFRSLRREFGRCTGRVYVDTPDGTPDAIGWVFVGKRDKAGWARETWVTYKEVGDAKGY